MRRAQLRQFRGCACQIAFSIFPVTFGVKTELTSLFVQCGSFVVVKTRWKRQFQEVRVSEIDHLETDEIYILNKADYICVYMSQDERDKDKGQHKGRNYGQNCGYKIHLLQYEVKRASPVVAVL